MKREKQIRLQIEVRNVLSLRTPPATPRRSPHVMTSLRFLKPSLQCLINTRCPIIGIASCRYTETITLLNEFNSSRWRWRRLNDICIQYVYLSHTLTTRLHSNVPHQISSKNFTNSHCQSIT